MHLEILGNEDGVVVYDFLHMLGADLASVLREETDIYMLLYNKIWVQFLERMRLVG